MLQNVPIFFRIMQNYAKLCTMHETAGTGLYLGIILIIIVIMHSGFEAAGMTYETVILSKSTESLHRYTDFGSVLSES